MICQRCSWPRGDGCTCPTDEVTWRARWMQVQARHRAAVRRAAINDHQRRLRESRTTRRAS